MRIVVIGGTGLIGRSVVRLLGERGHEVVAASPTTGVNTVTKIGLPEALEGAQVVVDLGDAPSYEAVAAREYFERSTRNLLHAEARSGVEHARAGGSRSIASRRRRRRGPRRAT